MKNQRISPTLNFDGQPPYPMAEVLKAHLSGAEMQLLQAIVEINQDQNLSLYIVGGLVRDLLLGKPSFDFDLVLEGDAIKWANKIAKQLGGKITSHPRFGTAVWTLSADRQKIASQLGIDAEDLPQTLDVISARHESYTSPGALPEVTFADIKADTGRRDFSINTLAIRLDGQHFGELFDFWEGVEDLKKGILRVLHDRSFEDDPTRILRIIRFKGRLDFNIEAASANLLKKSLAQLAHVSGERIRNELDKVFAEKSSLDILVELEKAGVLKAIHAGFGIDKETLSALKELNSMEISSEWDLNRMPKTWLAMCICLMSCDQKTGLALSEIFNLEKEIREALLQLNDWQASLAKLEKMSPSQATFWLDTLSPLARLTLFVRGSAKKGADIVKTYLNKWQYIQPHTKGNDLKQMGLNEGPQYADILDRLRAGWLNNEISSAEDEKRLLASLINNKDNR